jgi:hypothetical protein
MPVGGFLSKPVLPRDYVHRLSEECAKEIGRFQTVAKRLLDSQPRLVRFFRDNMPVMPGQSGEVSLYLLAVILHIYSTSGKLGKVGEAEIGAATRRIVGRAKGWLPGTPDFPSHVRGVEDRIQPHILDEALQALFERTEKRAEEVDIPPDQAALMFLMLWAATEALDAAWKAPQNPAWTEA